ncbi:glyoxalase domain-containing protein 4 isoform X2 [Rhinatrema bivittatum]|uniref:glyoxalase domain-containing protein 4 isoform X2 n=1 Tax=Rhinatrema bivittatum TaxID=194408 RepID=UPI00112BB2C0|nr:glyoxalase domain-containing protein 4 isoform X2 [Rhinatrema bivittatum]
MVTRRALHFVFKVGDRPQTARFYRDVLGMKILRHEEFEEGCKASCNGPYDGKWSKTMVGFGPEDHHFVVELTYNYGVGDYRLGNDFLGLSLRSSQAVSNAREQGWPLTDIKGGLFQTTAPGGYPFYLENEEQPGADPVQKCKLELQDIGEAVDHRTAFGRIAFSCPKEELPGIEALMKQQNQRILTPLVSLDTPGKATVQVVILADPDGHEICFVGDEAFRELSQVDPNGNRLLDAAMAADKSDEWFKKHKMQKASA